MWSFMNKALRMVICSVVFDWRKLLWCIMLVLHSIQFCRQTGLIYGQNWWIAACSHIFDQFFPYYLVSSPAQHQAIYPCLHLHILVVYRLIIIIKVNSSLRAPLQHEWVSLESNIAVYELTRRHFRGVLSGIDTISAHELLDWGPILPHHESAYTLKCSKSGRDPRKHEGKCKAREWYRRKSRHTSHRERDSI